MCVYKRTQSSLDDEAARRRGQKQAVSRAHTHTRRIYFLVAGFISQRVRNKRDASHRKLRHWGFEWAAC
jgi:hypothetical protein